ncbi:MAG: GYD domain-containing protein [Deinococcus sp.]|nr:GYD domain-containing protein [Deinococcus sp.]
MAKYMTLGRFRDELAIFTQIEERLAGAHKALAAVNGKLEAVYYTLGPYDFMSIIDVPDNQSAAAFLAWYAKLGVAETTTMPAFSAAEMQQVAGRMK